MTKKFLAAGVFTFLLSLPGIDPGGVGIDFSKNVREEKSGEEEAPVRTWKFETDADLKHWSHFGWVHLAPGDGKFNDLLNQAKPFLHRGVRENSLWIKTDPDMLKIRTVPGKIVMLSNRMEYPAFKLEGGQKYTLSFDLKGSLNTPENGEPVTNGFFVFISFSDEQGKGLGTPQKIFSLSPDFSQRKMDFIAPKATAKVHLVFAFYGSGEVFIRDLSIRRSSIGAGVSSMLMPLGLMDNRFCVPEKKPIPITFGLRNETGKTDGKAAFFLKLPEGFTIRAARRGNSLSELPDRTWRVDLTPLLGGISRNEYSPWGWSSINLMMDSELPPGEKLFRGEYWVENNGEKSPVKSFDLQVLPEFRAKQPVRFRSGFCLMNDVNYDKPGTNLFCEFLKNTGFNAGEYLPSPLELKQIGFTTYAEPMSNGYTIGHAPKPPEVLFLGADGKPFPSATSQNLCPVEVYRKGAYFTGQVVPELERVLAKCDNIMPNWEPYLFDNKGCFCLRCRDEFIAWSGLDPEAVKPIWGQKILEKHYDLWVKFRSHQHGELVRVLEETISTIGREKYAKESHFIPMISYTAMLEPNLHKQYDLPDYMKHVKWLNPWGPYIYYSLSEPYQHYCGWHLVTFAAAEGMRNYLKESFDDPAKMPKLIAFPHGFQMGEWVTEPEAISFEFLCFFLNRFEGSFAYLFPSGYDYRYWRDLARANDSIARYEKHVLEGEEISEQVRAVPVTPLPALNLPGSVASCSSPDGIKGLKKMSLLQTRAFRLGDSRFVAAGNFWQKGEVFFRLSMSGLDPAAKYAVFSPESGESFGAFSGKDLEKGILLHAGALRWTLLLVEPFRENAVSGVEFSQADMNRALEERKAALTAAAELERKKAGNAFSPENDYTLLPVRRSCGVEGKPVRKDGKDFISVTAPKYEALFDAEHGGRLNGWKSGGTLLTAENPSPGIGTDSFLKPDFRMFDGAWKLLGGVVDLEGVKYSLLLEVPEGTDPYYGGLRLLKNVTFLPDGVKIELIVENRSSSARSFVYRSHNQPALFGTRDGSSGKVLSGEVSMERPRKISFLALGKTGFPKELAPLYPNPAVVPGADSKLIFSAPWTKSILTASFSGEGMLGTAFWDEFGMPAPTTEGIYAKRTLAPGEKTVYSVNWEVR